MSEPKVIDLVWDYGHSDEMHILLLQKDGSGTVVVDEIKGKGEPLKHYIDRLLDMAREKHYAFAPFRMSALAHTQNLHGGPTAVGLLKAAGFKVEPLTIERNNLAGKDDPALASKAESEAVEAVVAAQKAAGDPIDPNGARRLIRVLVALGLLRFP